MRTETLAVSLGWFFVLLARLLWCFFFPPELMARRFLIQTFCSLPSSFLIRSLGEQSWLLASGGGFYRYP